MRFAKISTTTNTGIRTMTSDAAKPLPAEIDVTACSMKGLAEAAYGMSESPDVDFLRFKKNVTRIDKHTFKQIMLTETDAIKMSMDHVHGRAVKLTVFKGDGERLFIKTPWKDHTDDQLRALCRRVGAKIPGEDWRPPVDSGPMIA